METSKETNIILNQDCQGSHIPQSEIDELSKKYDFVCKSYDELKKQYEELLKAASSVAYGRVAQMMSGEDSLRCLISVTRKQINAK